MRVAELMSDRVETVGAEESAEKALRRMRTRRIHHLVVMLGARGVGVVSARDLESVADPRSFRTVREVMSAPAVTAEPHMTIRQAANLLRGRTIGCLAGPEEGQARAGRPRRSPRRHRAERMRISTWPIRNWGYCSSAFAVAKPSEKTHCSR